MDINERIAQWEKMTQEAPDDMSWFSLGNAYRDAGRLDDAAGAFASALACNPQMSRAYQMQGQVLIQLDRHDEAAGVLTQGYTIAAKRGDVMPQKAMGSLLEKIGRPVPATEATEAPAVDPGDADSIIDRRTGQRGKRLPDPPMRGPLGRFIYDHFSQDTWRQWISQGTKVINELRLDFSREEHQRAYDQQMMEWLGITREEVDAYAAQQASKGAESL